MSAVASQPKEILDWLRMAGILTEDANDHVSRVIIDVKVGEVVKVYIERFADEKLLKCGVDAGVALEGCETFEQVKP